MKPTNWPSWLSVEDGEFQIDEDRADVVRFIYRLAIDGKSPRYILDHLAREDIQPIGRRKTGKTDWEESDIHYLLTNPAVYGGENGEYPAIIPKSRWEDVQWMRSKVKGGRQETLKRSEGDVKRERSRNLLSGLLYCASCGKAVRLRSGKHYYVECYDGCFTKWSYKTLELLVIEHVFGTAWFIDTPWSEDEIREKGRLIPPVVEIRLRHAALLRRTIDRVEITSDDFTVVRRTP